MMLVQMAFMFLLMQQQMALAMCLSYLLLESISQFKPHTSSTAVPPTPGIHRNGGWRYGAGLRRGGTGTMGESISLVPIYLGFLSSVVGGCVSPYLIFL
jgi:hypothetical protein